MKKLKCVMLVDDDIPTNFLHKKIINDSGITENIVVAQDGQEALDYLTTIDDQNYIRPDIIFLDINMPVMDGWEFLTYYDELPIALKANQLMVMLTTSINPDDREKANKIDLVDDFLCKPLTLRMLEEILDKKVD